MSGLSEYVFVIIVFMNKNLVFVNFYRIQILHNIENWIFKFRLLNLN